jgi:hypothetical protein
MAKKLIRLTESDLHRIVKESVKRVLREDMEKQEFIYNPNNGPADSLTGGKFKLPNGQLTNIKGIGEEVAGLVQNMRTLYGDVNTLVNGNPRAFSNSQEGNVLFYLKQVLNDCYEKLWFLNERGNIKL